MSRSLIVAYVDGIGSQKLPEGSGDSVLAPIAAKVARDLDGRMVKVDYPAQMAGIGGPLTWEQSAVIGVEMLERVARDHPGAELVLLGYSGGCLPLHDWLDTHPEHHGRIRAVGFLSDPFRPYGRVQAGTGKLIGWGIAGQRLGPIPDRTYWTSAAGDVISDAHPDALLRTVADVSKKIPGGFLDALTEYVAAGDFQLAWQLHLFRTNPLGWFGTLGRRLHQARLDIEGYIFSGRHTRAYHEPHPARDGKHDSLADRLAATLVWKAR